MNKQRIMKIIYIIKTSCEINKISWKNKIKNYKYLEQDNNNTIF